MLVSSSHNFVFVHTAKTGGASVRRALSAVCPRETATNIDRLKLLLPFRYPVGSLVFPAHTTARQGRRALGRDFFDNAFSFAFVRNPFDWFVSGYEYRRKYDGHHSHNRPELQSLSAFAEYKSEGLMANRMGQLDMVSGRKGEILVSKIYRFENFADSFNDAFKQIGIDVENKVPHVNKTERTDYRTYYDDETRERIATLYARDLDAFGYEF